MNPGYQSPYPRNNVFRTPRREIDIAAIGEAWGIVSKNLGPFILAALAMIVLQQAPAYIGSLIGAGMTMGMSNSQDPATALTAILIQTGVSLPFSLIGAALGTIVAGSIVLMALKAVRGGTPEVGDIGLGFTTNPIGLLVTGFLVGLGTTIGTYLCLIPGLILGGLWFITTPYMLDKGLGPIEAMSASWQTMKDNIVMAAVIFLLAGLAAALGICLCGIGILVTFPIMMATQAIIYEDLTSDDASSGFTGGSYPTDPFSAYSTPPGPGQGDPFASQPAPSPAEAAQPSEQPEPPFTTPQEPEGFGQSGVPEDAGTPPPPMPSDPPAEGPKPSEPGAPG